MEENNYPQEGILSEEESRALMQKWMLPEYMKERYDNMVAVDKFMGLCIEGSGWIMAVNDYCQQQGITPQELIEFYKRNYNEV